VTERPSASSTVPAPPIPPHSSLPVDLLESLESHGPGQPRSSDPNVVDAALVRAALAAFSQSQADARKELNERFDEIRDEIKGLKGEIQAVGSILGSRIDVLEEHAGERLDTLAREAKTIAHAVDEHTSQIKEVLRFATQTYDMSTSAARKAELIREHLGISDELDAQAETESSQARDDTDENA